MKEGELRRKNNLESRIRTITTIVLNAEECIGTSLTKHSTHKAAENSKFEQNPILNTYQKLQKRLGATIICININK